MDIGEWIHAGLELILIVMVGAGLVQAARLIKHLAGLQEGRIEMERFVRDFSATVYRAEAGIKGLKQAARETGDDLEKLVEKGQLIRDELNYLVESADQIADRLSHTASQATAQPQAAPDSPAAARASAETKPALASVAKPTTAPAAASAMGGMPAVGAQPSSRAEQELLQALQKLS